MIRVALLMSDTGGGHRAAARAVETALDLRYPGVFTCSYVDVLREYGLPPSRRASEIYSWWIRNDERSYGLYFRVSDRAFRIPFLRSQLPGLLVRRRTQQLVERYRPDICVMLHAMFPRFLAAARERLELETPLLTVVTDFAKPHQGWLEPKVDRCCVPVQAAWDHAVRSGMPREKLRLVGHPAHPKYALCRLDRAQARAKLGWDADLPTAILLGGGYGMGSLEAVVREAVLQGVEGQLAIVCGKNEALARRLEALRLPDAWRVYGFVDHLEVMMRAADALVTKAGPGTITEAAIMGLPTILSGAIPYQETPNLAYVVQKGAGVEARGPRRIAATLRTWLADPDGVRRRHAEAARRMARPRASFLVADEVASLCGVGDLLPRDVVEDRATDAACAVVG
jgi:1,2-diacylglycerol 3-beta-galactosyltransferase